MPIESGEDEILLETFVRMRRVLRQRVAGQPPAGDAERAQRLPRERFVGLQDLLPSLLRSAVAAPRRRVRACSAPAARPARPW